MTGRDARGDMERAVADAVTRVPGVAWLRPGLAGLLRTGTARLVRPAPGREPVPGVRAGYDRRRHRWHVDVKLTTLSGFRAVDVTRAARAAAAGAVRDTDPTAGGREVTGIAEAAEITVTVTGVL